VGVAKLDRLSRDVHFISGLMAERVRIAELGVHVDPSIMNVATSPVGLNSCSHAPAKIACIFVALQSCSDCNRDTISCPDCDAEMTTDTAHLRLAAQPRQTLHVLNQWLHARSSHQLPTPNFFPS